jgi:hypothetical protein
MVHSAVSQARRLLRAVSPSRFQLSSLRGEVGIVLALLGFAVVFNLYYLQPEIVIRVPKVNDGVMHVLALRQAVDALGSGWDPTDPWLSAISMGYPLFHYYQHLAYFPPAVFYKLFSALVSLPDVFNWTDYLLLSLFPLSIYWSMRRFGFSRLTSALASVVSSLLATDGLYGFDYNSYVWRGYGLYTQLWGMVLLPPALAQGYTALKEGRGYFWAALLLAATALAHLVFGYIALISLVLFAVLSPSRREIFQRSRRFVLLLVSFALATAYFFIPLLRDSAYLNRSVWDAPEKYDSYGFGGVMGRLFSGELFDYGRFPSLTILAGLGLAVCLWRWREERFRVPAALSVLWLLLYMGRPVWGFLFDLQPLGRDLYLHRLIAGVHVGGIFLIGLGLALPWRWALSRGGTLTRKGALYLLLPAVFTAAVLYPVFNERIGYFDGNDTLMQFSRNANAIEERDVSALISRLQVSPPGRVYAGLAGTWGRDYKVGYVPMYSILSAAGLDMLGYLYHPWSLNGDIQVLFDERRPEEYNLFNVRYVVAPKDRTFPDFVRPVQDFGRHRLYEVQTTGYFDLVDSPAAFTGSKRDFYPAASRWLSSDLPAQKEHPALFLAGGAPDVAPVYPLTAAEQVISGLHLTPGPSRGTIVSQTTGEDSYTAVVKVERESYLALKITYHPNWHAYVDGEEADTVMLMPSFEAVKLTPGAHLVRFEYRPPALRGYLLLLGLLSLTVVGIAEWQRGKLAQVTKRLKLDRFSYPSGLSALTAALEARVARLVPFTIGRDIVKRKRDSLAGATARLKQYVVQGLSAGLDLVTGRPARAQALRALLAKKGLASHLPFLGVLGVAAVLAGLPLFHLKLMSGHDALAYLPRYVEFYEGLKAGVLFPRWAPDLGWGYGEPTFNFNPPLFYYVSAFFHALGFSFIASENLAIFALLLLAGLGMYLLASEFFGRRGGLVSAVAYLFAPYLLSRLYVSHALADFSAFAPIPLAFWGLYRYTDGGRYTFLVIGALAVTLLLLSSGSLSLIALPALLLFLAWLAWARRTWMPALRGIWCLMLGLGLSAFFLLPALTETDFVHLYRRAERIDFHDHFIYLRQLVWSPWGYGLDVAGPHDGMSFAVGPVYLALAAAALLLIRRIWAASRPAGLVVSFFLALLVPAVFFTNHLSVFFWERLPLIDSIQFPMRFLSLIAVSTAFLCGFPFLLIGPEKRWWANGAMVAMIAAILLLGFPHAKPETSLDVREADYSPQNIAAKGIPATAREFEPIWVKEFPSAPATERLTFLAGKGDVLVAKVSPFDYEFVVWITEPARLRVNTFYFPGWSLHVDGAQRPIDYSNPQGLMEFPLELGGHLVEVHFGDTSARTWGTRLSLLALLCLLLTPLLAKGRSFLSARRRVSPGARDP